MRLPDAPRVVHQALEQLEVGLGVGAVTGLPFFFGEADKDDHVGTGGAVWSVAEVIGNNDHEVEFKLTGGGEGHGRYFVEGSIRRTDTDEVPAIAAITAGAESIKLYARDIGDRLTVYASKDSGRTFESKGLFKETRRFRSGPGAAASADGRHRHVLGLSTDDHFFHTRSHDDGDSWTEWQEMGEKEFESAPAVACSNDGKRVHVLGRARDDRFWHRASDDAGHQWNAWEPVREAEFRSSPALAVSRDGSRLLAFGIAQHKVWHSASDDHGRHWTRWEEIPVPIAGSVYDEPMRKATSAPAAAFSFNGKTVHLVCRGIDRSFNWTESTDGGRTWPSRWHRIAGETLNSSPALVLDGGSSPCYFGLGDDLTLQRCVGFGGTLVEPEDPRLEWQAVLRGPAPFDIQPLFY